MFSEFTSFQTPTPSQSRVPSPQVGVLSTPERVDLTPEGVARHFLQIRSLLNQHVSQEREKGVRIRLDYDEPEPSLLPSPPPPPFTNSQPSTSHFEASPSMTSQPFNPTPYAHGRPSPTAFPLFSSQPAVTGTPLGHEITLEQLWQSPVSSVPPPVATTWEQALAVLLLARSAAMSTPMGTNHIATVESLQGFNMMPQMMAHFPWSQFINQVLSTHQGTTSHNSKVEEDLAKPYKPSNLSCFSQQIADYDFQTKIKMPSHIRTYDGTEDPEDHLQIFTGAVRIEKLSNTECCLMFMQTLIGSARIWFNAYLPEAFEASMT